MASALPARLAETLHAVRDQQAEPFGSEEFSRRIVQRTGRNPHTPQSHARAVLTTVAEAVSTGELQHIFNQIPHDFAALFSQTAAGG
ncbi:uncharacterized protein (DUF2267 family) [Streptomyces sp. V1I6]|nr:uncharacterized protein (DUF2267 family) [Streptomyces sp. V1I6]